MATPFNLNRETVCALSPYQTSPLRVYEFPDLCRVVDENVPPEKEQNMKHVDEESIAIYSRYVIRNKITKFSKYTNLSL